MRYMALLFVLIAAPAFAQEDYDKLCKDWRQRSEITQAEMTTCAGHEAQVVEAELEQTYQGLLTGVRNLNSDVGGPAVDPTSAIEKIKAAQSAWIRYRDAYIDATFPLENKQQEYGTMYSMRVSGLRAALTRDHIKLLRILCRDSVAQWLAIKYCGTP